MQEVRESPSKTNCGGLAGMIAGKGRNRMLSTAEIKKFIDADAISQKKKRAAEGQRYYDAEHDIMNCRFFYYTENGQLVEDKQRANIKISHPFFMILADQLAPFMLSFDGNAIKAKQGIEGLQEHLDTYFDDEFWTEVGDLVTGTYTKGFEYLYGYKNEDERLAFQCGDSLGIVEVEARFASDNQDHVIHSYVDRIDKDGYAITKIVDWDAQCATYYEKNGRTGRITKDKSVEVNPRPHVVFLDEKGDKKGYPFGFIPFWRLDNNKRQISGLKPIKNLIDDYDLHACSLSNNLKDFDTPIYAVSGFEGENLDELHLNLQTKKMIGVDSEGGIDVQTVDIPYQARKEKLDIDKDNIFTFGMGFDPTKVGDGNVTNVVIKSRYTLLELKANKMQDRLCALLKEIVKVVLDEINDKHEKDYQMTDVFFEFKRAIMTNESENIANAKVEAETRQIEVNTVLNVAAQVGDEQTLKAVCEILDWDYKELEGELEKVKETQNFLNAQADLGGVVVD